MKLQSRNGKSLSYHKQNLSGPGFFNKRGKDTVLIAQYTIIEFYNAEISIPMVIDLKDLNVHD